MLMTLSTCVRQALQFAIVIAVVSMRSTSASAQSSPFMRQLEPILEPASFRTPPAPTGEIKLRGWVIPGHQLAGSALEQPTLAALEPHASGDSVVSTAPIRIES